MRGELGKCISTQHLRRLQYPERDALPVFDYIDALGEHPFSKRKLEYSGAALPSEDELWPLVSNRNRFLADQSIRRLCVTVEGGVGKTKLLEELEASVAHDHPDQVVIRLDLRHLPTEADHFLDSGPTLLARWAWTELKQQRKQFAANGLLFPELGNPDESEVIPDEVLNMVQLAARTGDLCLIVDSFDQLDKRAAWERAEALNDFISSKYFPKVRCIIAGRPYAIKRIWDALQLGELRSQDILEDENQVRIQNPVWEFCKLQKFDADQVKEYLSGLSTQDGADKLIALKRMDAEEIHLPRTLNIIRQLTAGQLREMQTTADLYWHAINKTIIDNFRRARTEYQLQYLRLEHVRHIVAAVTFAMLIWKDEPVVEVPSIQTDKSRDFFRFMKSAGFYAVLEEEGIDFHEALLDLAQVDSESIQFHFYSESPTREAPAEICDIRMSDATIRDFFAAHWAARYLKHQIEWLESQKMATGLSTIDLALRLRDNVNSDDFKRFWQLLVGMPNESPVTHEEAATEESWTAAVAPLFEVRESRPTELMYRCWPDLLWRAGFMDYRDHVDAPNWNETPMAEGTRKAQLEVKKLFESRAIDQSMGPARRLVALFLSDYLKLCKAQEIACMADPEVTSEMKSQFYLDCDFVPIDIQSIPIRSKESENERKERLAYLNEHYPLWLLERSFRVIEGGPFLYGEKPDPSNPAYVNTFAINAFLLSKAMYGCFEEYNESGASDKLRAKPINSWYASLMCALWCHALLPDEHAWEAAARGKVKIMELDQHWIYGYGCDQANLEKYSDYGRSFNEKPSDIGHRFPTTKAELYDIHGQLHELCADVYEQPSWVDNAFNERPVCRVMRGGAFNYSALYARCSIRFRSGWSNSPRYVGLRLYRVFAPELLLRRETSCGSDGQPLSFQ